MEYLAGFVLVAWLVLSIWSAGWVSGWRARSKR